MAGYGIRLLSLTNIIVQGNMVTGNGRYPSISSPNLGTNTRILSNAADENLNTYKSNSVDPINLTGTVSTTSGSGTVTGVATLFTTELRVGDTITVNAVNKVVVDIHSATSLTISGTFAANNSGVTYSVNTYAGLNGNADRIHMFTSGGAGVVAVGHSISLGSISEDSRSHRLYVELTTWGGGAGSTDYVRLIPGSLGKNLQTFVAAPAYTYIEFNSSLDYVELEWSHNRWDIVAATATIV